MIAGWVIIYSPEPTTMFGEWPIKKGILQEKASYADGLFGKWSEVVLGRALGFVKTTGTRN